LTVNLNFITQTNGMKKILPLLFLSSLALLSAAQLLPKRLDSKVSDVTVYLNGAQITEVVNLPLKEGENAFKISDLTMYMDPNSIQISGSDAFTILSARHEINHLSDHSSHPRVKILKDSLEDLQVSKQEIAGLIDALEQERIMLESNRMVKGENSTLIQEDLKEMAEFFRNRHIKLNSEKLDLQIKDNKINKEIERVSKALNQLNSKYSNTPSEIIFHLLADKTMNSNVKISYFIQQAGWQPIYDIRARDINSQIEIGYRAKVFQNSGKDWERVNITLSTGNPIISMQPPSISPWYINIYEPIAVPQQNKRSYAPEAAPSSRVTSTGADDAPQALSMENYVSISNNAVNSEFKIDIPYSVPSDGQHYDVTIRKSSYPTKYQYYSAPKMDAAAYLRAEVTQVSREEMLAGETQIYFGNTFVGKGFIDPTQMGDTLLISLGRDNGINIKRETVKDFCKTTAFGGNQKTSKAYEVTIQNNKKVPVEILIEDQVPISQNGDLEVELADISGGFHDLSTGKVSWKLQMNPGQTEKRKLYFNCTYPKKKFVNGL
jgi:uncharacterized protein (TIGR02231 family)